MTKTAAELYAEADNLEKQSEALREQAAAIERNAQLARPLIDRLVFSAGARCACGLGLAYDPAGEVAWHKDSPLRGPNAWDCSGVLLETAPAGTTHDSFPFAFYEIKSENQPSALGATTRPKAEG
jgi:hypothetical protein